LIAQFTVNGEFSPGFLALFQGGAKPKGQPSDLAYLPECLDHAPRTYTSGQLAEKLNQERLVDLSRDRLRRLLKQKDIGGNELDTAVNGSKTPSSKRVSRPT